jgi:DNA-binding transcriptional MocR family regulator
LDYPRLPVLKEVTRRLDAGEFMPQYTDIAETLGIDKETVILAGKALERRGLVELTRGMAHRGFDDVSGEAYLITGLHPNGDDALTGLIEALQQAADQVDDPDERSALRRAANGVLGVSREVMAGVLTGVSRNPNSYVAT